MFPKSFLEEHRKTVEDETKSSNPKIHKIRMDYEVLNNLKQKFQNLSIEEKNKYIKMDLDKGIKTFPLIETEKAKEPEKTTNSTPEENTLSKQEEKEEKIENKPISQETQIDKAIESFIKEGFDPNEEDLVTEVALLHNNDSKTAGKVRILKNKENGRVRVLMRTNQHNKILLNHYVNPDLNISINDISILYDTVDFADISNPSMIKVNLQFPHTRKEHAKFFYDKLTEAQGINKNLLSK